MKLLHLFFNHPGESFYVREITRKIEEQINSVRRELSNMLEVGVIISDSSDNKLYYQVNQDYDYYTPLRAIFADNFSMEAETAKQASNEVDNEDQRPDYVDDLVGLKGLRVCILSGVLAGGPSSSVDVMLVGSPSSAKVNEVVSTIEATEGRDINYTVIKYDEFYYRLSVRDRFIMQIINGSHKVILDKDNILSKG